MAKTKDALKILDRVTGNNASVRAGIVQAKINFEVAQMIYDARTKAGLSQGQLAALIGSKQHPGILNRVMIYLSNLVLCHHRHLYTCPFVLCLCSFLCYL